MFLRFLRIISDISLSNDEDWPSWIEKDLTKQIITLNPSGLNDLYSLRSVLITFATQISFSELSAVSIGKNATEVLNALLLLNYLNANRVPTINYQQNAMLPLDASFNLSAIQTLMNNHFYLQTVTFVLDDFMDLDTPPMVTANSIQSQFDKQVSIHLNKDINFQMADDTFLDLEQDTIVSSVENLPNWLFFYADSKKFIGTPTTSDMGDYRIQVIASDSFKNSSDYFKITVFKQKPLSFSIDNQNLILGKSLLFSIPISTFIDLDGDSLKYQGSFG